MEGRSTAGTIRDIAVILLAIVGFVVWPYLSDRGKEDRLLERQDCAAIKQSRTAGRDRLHVLNEILDLVETRANSGQVEALRKHYLYDLPIENAC